MNTNQQLSTMRGDTKVKVITGDVNGKVIKEEVMTVTEVRKLIKNKSKK